MPATTVRWAAKHLNAPVVGMAATPNGEGYWLVASDGGIFSFGNAGYHGSMGAKHLNAPVVGMAATPNGEGYWLVASDGGIFSFGNAGYHGSMGAKHLNAPVVGMAATPNGEGYWLVASDGGIFSFGNAGYHGSMAASHPANPIDAIAVGPGGRRILALADHSAAETSVSGHHPRPGPAPQDSSAAIRPPSAIPSCSTPSPICKQTSRVSTSRPR